MRELFETKRMLLIYVFWSTTTQVYEEIAEGNDEVDLNGRKVNTRAYCSWYNFKSTDQSKKCAMLSGGERNRVHLAKTLKQSGNLLLL